ncbi:cobalamin B12-binding domain-containing protein [Streptomyces tropicalis]|uniref:Cobalamin-dependent protein n=1 Tax=Streptomyces tropicalis TaxID=3034234 RepID=A0ABT6AA47_9ACTN|nr:cobalamin-dependent protein [Streptomyces tropicalis]MDF3301529.1 cobalamin-dependent protein [Streptomyces tropicalis]
MTAAPPAPRTRPEDGPQLSSVRERLWEAVLDGDEYAAVDVVLGARDAGLDEETLLLDVIGAVQQRVGVEWAADRISVAQEHATTAINERAVAALSGAGRRPGARPRGRVTVTCVDGEWHALPARLVAEVLRLRGWQVDYLGAQTPTPHLIAHVHRTNPAAVLLSSSLPTRLPTAHAAITACQAVGMPVMAGGAAFGEGGRYARLLGADHWARDARDAADLLEGGTAQPYTSVSRQAVDDLPHLADQEYTMVARSRPRLVKQTLADLEDRFPAMAAYDDAQRERTAEDIAHIVDFLAAALYVDDARLFAGFLTWTADILAARGVPVHSLALGLDVLSRQLHDFPRSSSLLEQGASALAGHRPGSPAAGPGSGA